MVCRWPALYRSTERAVGGLQKAPSTVSILSNPFKFQGVFNFENMVQNCLLGNRPFSATGHRSSVSPFQFRPTWFLPEGYPRCSATSYRNEVLTSEYNSDNTLVRNHRPHVFVFEGHSPIEESRSPFVVRVLWGVRQGGMFCLSTEHQMR